MCMYVCGGRYTVTLPYTQINSVTPTSGPLYSSIQLQGNSQSQNYNRVFAGDGLCVTPGLNTNQLFGPTCQTTAAQVGGVNATAIVTGMGASWNHS